MHNGITTIRLKRVTPSGFCIDHQTLALPLDFRVHRPLESFIYIYIHGSIHRLLSSLSVHYVWAEQIILHLFLRGIVPDTAWDWVGWSKSEDHPLLAPKLFPILGGEAIPMPSARKITQSICFALVIITSIFGLFEKSNEYNFEWLAWITNLYRYKLSTSILVIRISSHNMGTFISGRLKRE